MTRRAAIMMVVRSLVCGLVLTFAAARVDDVRMLLWWSPSRPTEMANGDGFYLLRLRHAASERLSAGSFNRGSPPPLEAMLRSVPLAEWWKIQSDNSTANSKRGNSASRIQAGPAPAIVAYLQGWPMRAFLATENMMTGEVSGAMVWKYRGDRYALALSPLWVGLAVDTLFFACVVGATEIGLRGLRRWSRRRAGKCAGCGYSRAGLAAEQVCPECGK